MKLLLIDMFDFARMWWHFKVYRKICAFRINLRRNADTDQMSNHDQMTHEEESMPLDPELILWYQSKFSPSDSCEHPEDTFMMLTNEDRTKTAFGRLDSLLRRYSRYSAWTRNHFISEDIYVLCVWKRELQSLGIKPGTKIPKNVKTCYPLGL
jgi:hypothetical protein